MRYAGLGGGFHAIIRKMDVYILLWVVIMQGVGNFYKKYEAQELIKKYEKSIGINIIYSKGPYYCSKCSQIVTSNICKHSGSKYEKQISGTYIGLK